MWRRLLVKQLGELSLEHLFAYIRLWAFPLVAGAVIVDVPPLLNLPDDRAAAVPAAPT